MYLQNPPKKKNAIHQNCGQTIFRTLTLPTKMVVLQFFKYYPPNKDSNTIHQNGGGGKEKKTKHYSMNMVFF
jgi:hypothetical protein